MIILDEDAFVLALPIGGRPNIVVYLKTNPQFVILQKLHCVYFLSFSEQTSMRECESRFVVSAAKRCRWPARSNRRPSSEYLIRVEESRNTNSWRWRLSLEVWGEMNLESNNQRYSIRVEAKHEKMLKIFVFDKNGTMQSLCCIFLWLQSDNNTNALS